MGSNFKRLEDKAFMYLLNSYTPTPKRGNFPYWPSTANMVIVKHFML